MIRRVKQTSAMLVAALVLSNVAVPMTNQTVVYAAEAQDAESTTLSAGVYYVPVGLMNESKPENPSMAANCVGSYGVLTVKEDGTMDLQITLKTLETMGLYGNATDIKVFSSYSDHANSSQTSATVVTTRTAKSGSITAFTEVTVPEKVSFTLPYTDQNGVYISMYVDAMGMSTNAFLSIDYTNVIDASNLNEQLAAAESIDTTIYTADTLKAFTAAYTTAQETVSASSMTQEQADKAAEALKTAIKSLILKDGTYNVPVSIYQSSKDTLSMVNGGINQSAEAVVKDGKVTLKLSFSQLVHYGVAGYISAVSTLDNIVFNESNIPTTYDLVASTVLSTHDAVDEFNAEDSTMADIAGMKYPNEVEIVASAADEFTWLNLYIPVMAGMGHGNQLVRLHTDYTAATAKATAVAPTLAISKSSATIYTSGTTSFTLAATVTGDSKTVSYESSNEKVATVSSTGEVKAVAAGTATITVTANGITKTCTVTVKEAKLTLNKSKATIYTSGTKSVQLSATVTGASSNVTYKSSNEKVATVSSTGVVKAVAAGTAIITVTSNGITKTCTVTVKEAKLTLNKSKATIYTSGTTYVQLSATVTGASSNVSYKTSDKKVATVSSTGKVKAVGAGTATITVTSNGITKTCTVTVKKATVKLNKTKATIYTAGTTSVQLKATVTGASSKVTYTSSDTKVAKVNKTTGKVTAVAKGTATITATSNGVKTTCTITVKKPTLKVAKSALTVKKNKTVTIKATATPSKTITYKSSDTKIAKVNKKGVVTGVSKGTAKIKVTCNGVTKTVTVTVK